MNRTILAGLLIVIAASSVFAATSARYRTPESFSELPPAAIATLKKEGCLIPQAGKDPEYMNVISGAFASPKQNDWAVLCAAQRREYIRVFWGGPTKCASRIDVGPLILDTTSKPIYWYSHVIIAANKKYITEHYQRYGGVKPPKITHLGVEFGDIEKGSLIYYCHAGQWLRLTGAD